LVHLGLQRCPAFDIAAACAGFIYGLSIADRFVASGARNVLVGGVELLSRGLNRKDRTTCVLFGDGAGAAIVSAADGTGSGILSTHIYADGSQANALQILAGGSALPASQHTLDHGQHYVSMQGQDVFKHVVCALSSASITALEANGFGRVTSSGWCRTRPTCVSSNRCRSAWASVSTASC